MRLIDADALKKDLSENYTFYGFRQLLNDFYEALDSAPSIDIVRCRECRRVREDGGHANCNGYLYCRKWKTLVDEDGYCSWGEREGE